MNKKSAIDKKSERALNRAFYKKYKLHRHPLMGGVFDLIEGIRAIPNGRTPFDGEIKIEHDVAYKNVGGQKLLMDVYYPSRPIGERSPAILMIPGGGWMIHNRSRRDGYARCFAVLGAVVAVIDHRLCPEVFFPDNLVDCIDAYNFLAENSERFGIDKNNITVTGDSSGGHLAACIGCASINAEYVDALHLPTLLTKPSALIFISGAFSFDVMLRLPFTQLLMVRYVCGLNKRKEFKNWKFYKYINPYNFLSAEFPPSYNNGGGTDFLCAGEAKRMAKKLTAAGVQNEYKVGKSVFNSMHCYVLRFPFKSARKDALLLYKWYCKRQLQLGVDMGEGLQRIDKFMTHYKKSLKGKTVC